MKRRRDRRVWSEFGGATEVNGVIAIQNPDRHVNKEDRKQYQKDWRARYIAKGPLRRQVNFEVVCQKCWQLKHADGSDGLGGFTPDNTRGTGWMKLCRQCLAAAKKQARARAKDQETRAAEAVEVPGYPPEERKVG